MPGYEVRGKGKESGRKRKRVYSAVNEQAARQLAESDGIFIEEIVLSSVISKKVFVWFLSLIQLQGSRSIQAWIN